MTLRRSTAARGARKLGRTLSALLMTCAAVPALAGTEGFPAPPAAPAGAPNVIVIMTDDVGFGATSAFGGEIPTPNFDRVAQNGLRYANFHTTGVCSPSRAALLTGRNHHAVGTGTVVDLARSDAGYTSIIPKSAATVAQLLRANGYSTAAFGKHHNIPTWQNGPLGPFDQWMSGLGFDYFYGFNAGETDQFFPALVENNSTIEPPDRPDYIFERDMADHALQWLRTQRAGSGGKPFLLYYAPGTAHWPLHAPADWIARFRGKFDDGYDVLRQRIFARQKRMGVIPANARLAPMPPEVKPWHSLGADEKRLYARYMEAYAAALAFCDDQIGRLFEDLRVNGQLDNTLIVYIQGDNGSTPEGGPSGMFQFGARADIISNTAEALARIDEIGGPRSYPAAPLGYMMAMNTPFPYYKMMASRLGGITSGMAVSWPARIAARGVRRQFTHLTDIMPTVLEAAGIELPASFNGIRQQPIDGISLTYSFADAKAPERHRQQYFEVFGNAALYRDGWMVASPVMPIGRIGGGAAASASKWQLYDLGSDSSQTIDLADRLPDKLAEMRHAFDAEARRNQVFPILHNGMMELLPQNRPEVTAREGRFAFYPSDVRYTDGVFPSTPNRSWSVDAQVEVTDPSAGGVLVAQGGRLSGWGLVMLKGIPTFLYRTGESESALTRLAPSAPLAPGTHNITVSFSVDGPGLGRGGALTMLVDGQPVATGRMEKTIPVRFSTEGASVGHDTGTPLVDDYRVPFPFRGLRAVTFDLGPAQVPTDSKPHDPH